MSNEWSIGRHRGRLALVWWENGKRRRYSLGTDNPGKARALAPALFEELTRPRGGTVEEIWEAYRRDRAGRRIAETMGYSWKSLSKRFATRDAESITIADCRAHTAERRDAGIADGTIHTELGHLRIALKWAESHGLIRRAPAIERPAKPKTGERHLTRDELRRLISATSTPHVRLFILLAYTTAARSAALFDLTWDRVDFDRGRIDLRNPALSRPHKGRAIVPMLDSVRGELLAARRGALTRYVIEWGGKPVKSVKRGLNTTAAAADLKHVSPHMLRHSAAVHMAEDGVGMEEIAQFLGHSSSTVTRNIYARFSPDYLARAARALELPDLARPRLLPGGTSAPKGR